MLGLVLVVDHLLHCDYLLGQRFLLLFCFAQTQLLLVFLLTFLLELFEGYGSFTVYFALFSVFMLKLGDLRFFLFEKLLLFFGLGSKALQEIFLLSNILDQFG
jgi:hypothetical protein